MTTQPTQPTPAVLGDAPVLAQAVRGGFVESVHRASVAVTAADGSVELELGSATGPVFPRSSNKPIQALAMVRHGLDLAPRHLALVCASHSGEDFHLTTKLRGEELVEPWRSLGHDGTDEWGFTTEAFTADETYAIFDDAVRRNRARIDAARLAGYLGSTPVTLAASGAEAANSRAST